MEKNERLNALEIALANEMNERQFYLNNAARTSNPVGKVMFERLAEDEREHYEMLKKLHGIWSAEGKWPETVPLTIKETNVKGLLKKLVQESKIQDTSNYDDLEALNIAAQFESKGADTYRELAESSDEQKVKDFFLLLSRIEREHYLTIKDMEEFLKNPQGWFLEKEKPTLDGA